MRYLTGRFRPALAGAAFVFLVGCQTTEAPQSNPGNLPRPLTTNYEPRVNASTFFAHGNLLERQGQFERAVVQYRKALERQPDFIAALNRLGITLNKLGRNAEATALFSRAVALKPDTAHLHNDLGFSMYLEGRYADAAEEFEKALSIQYKYARGHMNYALALAKLERFDEAYMELTEACSPIDAYYNMGVILTEAEHYAEAAHYFEAVLEMRPDYESARVQLHEVSRLAAEWEARQAALTLAANLEQERIEAEALEQKAADLAAAEPTPIVQAARIEPADEIPAPETEIQPEEAFLQAPTQSATPLTDQNPCDETDPDVVNVLWQRDREWLNQWTEADDWSWLQTLATDAAWDGAPPASGFADAKTWDQAQPLAPGRADSDLLSMIDAAAWAMSQEQWDNFDEIWCRLGYRLFPETAPDEPESDPGWLVDQRDLKAAAERPLAK